MSMPVGRGVTLTHPIQELFMDFERISDIAQQLGLNDQELTALMMTLHPN